jgi:hypothetical protein
VLSELIKCLKLIPQIIVEVFRSCCYPFTALKLNDRGSTFRVGVEASVEEVKNLLRMSRIDVSEGLVENIVEALFCIDPVVDPIEDLSRNLSEGEILGHNHQKSHS